MFNEIQEGIIIGSLLGDGHLRKIKDTHNSYLTIRRSFNDLNYLQWQYENLKSYCPSDIKILEIKENNKIFKYCEMRTKSLVELNKYRSDWYIDSIKIIPNNLKLDKYSMAVWAFDDGYFRFMNKNHGGGIQFILCSHSFSKDENIFLCEKLQDRYNTKFNLSKQRNKETIYYHISGYTDSAKAIFEDISTIDDIENFGLRRKMLWLDKEKYLSDTYKNYLKNKIVEQIVEFILINKSFKLSEIRNFEGLAFNKTENSKKNIALNTLKRYIHPLINNIFSYDGRGNFLLKTDISKEDLIKIMIDKYNKY